MHDDWLGNHIEPSVKRREDDSEREEVSAQIRKGPAKWQIDLVKSFVKALRPEITARLITGYTRNENNSFHINFRFGRILGMRLGFSQLALLERARKMVVKILPPHKDPYFFEKQESEYLVREFLPQEDFDSEGYIATKLGVYSYNQVDDFCRDCIAEGLIEAKHHKSYDDESGISYFKCRYVVVKPSVIADAAIAFLNGVEQQRESHLLTKARQLPVIGSDDEQVEVIEFAEKDDGEALDRANARIMELTNGKAQMREKASQLQGQIRDLERDLSARERIDELRPASSYMTVCGLIFGQLDGELARDMIHNEAAILELLPGFLRFLQERTYLEQGRRRRGPGIVKFRLKFSEQQLLQISNIYRILSAAVANGRINSATKKHVRDEIVDKMNSLIQKLLFSANDQSDKTLAYTDVEDFIKCFTEAPICLDNGWETSLEKYSEIVERHLGENFLGRFKDKVAVLTYCTSGDTMMSHSFARVLENDFSASLIQLEGILTDLTYLRAGDDYSLAVQKTNYAVTYHAQALLDLCNFACRIGKYTKGKFEAHLTDKKSISGAVRFLKKNLTFYIASKGNDVNEIIQGAKKAYIGAVKKKKARELVCEGILDNDGTRAKQLAEQNWDELAATFRHLPMGHIFHQHIIQPIVEDRDGEQVQLLKELFAGLKGVVKTFTQDKSHASHYIRKMQTLAINPAFLNFQSKQQLGSSQKLFYEFIGQFKMDFRPGVGYGKILTGGLMDAFSKLIDAGITGQNLDIADFYHRIIKTFGSEGQRGFYDGNHLPANQRRYSLKKRYYRQRKKLTKGDGLSFEESSAEIGRDSRSTSALSMEDLGQGKYKSYQNPRGGFGNGGW